MSVRDRIREAKDTGGTKPRKIRGRKRQGHGTTVQRERVRYSRKQKYRDLTQDYERGMVKVDPN